MDMNIGGRLDEAMRDASIPSQSQLARSSGVPQPTINRILKGQGKQGPETSTLIALARALNVEVRWLQTGNGPKRMGDAGGQAENDEHVTGAHLVAKEPPAARLLQWLTPREAEFLSELRARSESQQGRLLNALKRMPKSVADVPGRDKA
jgi:transcriptional regulator with XRE-family HTH domain